MSQGKGLSKAVTKPQSRQGPKISHIILLVLKKLRKTVVACLILPSSLSIHIKTMAII